MVSLLVPQPRLARMTCHAWFHHRSHLASDALVTYNCVIFTTKKITAVFYEIIGLSSIVLSDAISAPRVELKFVNVC